MASNLPITQNYRAIRRVLLTVLVANISVTIIKISLGLLTGALAVVADGFHSLVDSSSNLIGLAAIRLASRPPDERHPYGYARYETLGSLAIGGLLLAAAWEIGRAVIGRLGGGAPPEFDLLQFALIALTLPVNLLIVYLETRAGKRLNSEILLADATHTRTDLFVTASVIASLVGVWLGWPWLDTLVAAGVVILILRAAFSILRDTSSWLSDASVLDPDRVEAAAQQVPGVWYVHQVRSRGAPTAVFVDLHIKVYPGMSTDQAHGLATEVEERIKEQFPQVTDVLVHIEPGRLDLQTVDKNALPYLFYQQISYDLRQIADGMGLGIHDLYISQDQEGGLDIEAHLEFGRDLSLEAAHTQAEDYEQRIRERWPQARRITTHLEPLPEEVMELSASVDGRIVSQVYENLDRLYPRTEVLDVHTHWLDGYFSVAIRIRLPDESALVEAHELTEQIERDLIRNISPVHRVTVHVEPGISTGSSHG
jgi:cation diffusion facilitator family transporter